METPWRRGGSGVDGGWRGGTVLAARRPYKGAGAAALIGEGEKRRGADSVVEGAGGMDAPYVEMSGRRTGRGKVEEARKEGRRRLRGMYDQEERNLGFHLESSRRIR
jgi:hypothetical protein